jgi:hypothetical protein
LFCKPNVQLAWRLLTPGAYRHRLYLFTRQNAEAHPPHPRHTITPGRN